MTVAEFSCQPDQVASLFKCLFPSEVSVSAAAESDHSKSDKVVAVFRNDNGDLTGVCNADFEFAARAAASLTMIPVGGCNDAIKSNQLDSNYVENFNEVMNLMATLISMPGSRRAFLEKLIVGDDPIPEDVAALLASHDYASTLKADFSGYGDGVFSFYG